MSDSMVSFVESENGTVSAVLAGSTIAGIEPAEGGFKVNRAEDSALPEMGIFSTLPSAKQAIADFSGSTIAPVEGARKRATRKETSTPRKLRANTPAKGAKGARAAKEGTAKGAKPAKGASAPATARNVSPIMQRNLREIESGNYPVFVGDAATLATLKGSRAFKALVLAGEHYKNGTANIYPSPAQAKRIAKLVAGSDTALQCELGGYTPWRNSLRKRTPVTAS